MKTMKILFAVLCSAFVALTIHSGIHHQWPLTLGLAAGAGIFAFLLHDEFIHGR